MRATITASVLLLAALSGCSSGGTTPYGPAISHSPTESSAPTAGADLPLQPCADGTITAQVNDPEGTAGHLNYQIEFVNSGPECTLEGYPQVAVLGHGNGTQLGVLAAQMTGQTVSAVTIATGASAFAQLQAINIDPGGGPLGPDCAVEEGDGWNIYVPGAIEPTFVASAGVPACTSGVPWMEIGPISAS
jgi:hypothetical protein